MPRNRSFLVSHGSALALSACALVFALPLTTAYGADLAPRRPVIVPPIQQTSYDWTGYYAGVIAGTGRYWDHAVEYYTATGVATGQVYGYDLTGGSVGARIGANFQYGSIVVGAEADLEAARFSGGFVDGTIGAGHDKIDLQGSLRGRLGFAWDRLLVYGTAGLAFAQVETRYTFLATSTDEFFKDTRYGWTAGAGVDYALTDKLILGVDYRYTDFGKVDHVSTVAFGGLTGKHQQAGGVIHASLSYKF